MEIVYHDSLPSTHHYLEAQLQRGLLRPPIAIIADTQTAGVGSRGSAWQGQAGNLYLSFALPKSSLPHDLVLASASIYFSAIMIRTLKEQGSKLWLKWPNDFYLGDKKLGGTITRAMSGDILLCSMGINLKNSPKEFATIDINIEKKALIDSYFLKLKQVILWKDIFSQYQIEFKKSKHLFYTDVATKKKIPLSEATLCMDGSIMIENKRIYSLR